MILQQKPSNQKITLLTRKFSKTVLVPPPPFIEWPD